MRSTGKQALGDLRVIDLSTVLAGPGCARYLADFGADVIKVERPGAGDSIRDMGWRDPRDDVTFFSKIVGRGKRTIVLDLKDPRGARRHAPPVRLGRRAGREPAARASSRRSGWRRTT